MFIIISLILGICIFPAVGSNAILRKVDVNGYFCRVRYLSYIFSALGLFLILFQPKAATAAAEHDQKTAGSSGGKPAFTEKTLLHFPVDGKVRLRLSIPNASPLKRQIGKSCLPDFYLRLQQTPVYFSISIPPGREDNIPNFLCLLFPKHNFW